MMDSVSENNFYRCPLSPDDNQPSSAIQFASIQSSWYPLSSSPSMHHLALFSFLQLVDLPKPNACQLYSGYRLIKELKISLKKTSRKMRFKELYIVCQSWRNTFSFLKKAESVSNSHILFVLFLCSQKQYFLNVRTFISQSISVSSMWTIAKVVLRECFFLCIVSNHTLTDFHRKKVKTRQDISRKVNQ